MGWRDTIGKYFQRQAAGQASELARGASGEATMPRGAVSAPMGSGGMSLQYQQLATMLSIDSDLLLRFADYENMDDYGEITAALDIYADDATVADTVHGKVIWGESSDKVVRDIIDDLLGRRLRIEDDIWTAIRTLCKYGNLFCMPEGTRVWTEHGPRAIETVEPGTRVIGYRNGRKALVTVARRLDNGTREIFRVRTRHREFLATADHPVLVDRGSGKAEWVPVGDLRVVRWPASGKRKRGSINQSKTPRLVIATSAHDAKHVPEWKDLYEKEVRPKQRSVGGNVFNEFMLPERMEPWLCQLLGFLWGDGGLGTERMDVSNSTVWYARGVYQDRNDCYDDLLRRLHLDPNTTDDGTLTQVHSILFKCFLLSLGWHNGAGVKRLPEWLGKLPREHKQAFLDGFMDADGWVSKPATWKDKAYHYEIANVELARDLKNLIDGLGYRSGNLRMRTRRAPIINGKQVKRVREAATLTFSRHEFQQDFVSESLVEITTAGTAHVYDLEIADTAHNFVAEGVVVHNCEVVTNEHGVLGLNWLPPPTMRRVVDQRGTLVGYVQDPSGMFAFSMSTQEDLDRLRAQDGIQGAVFFQPWEVVHWRLRGKQQRALYGFSILDSARWVWKRLLMLEDSTLANRLQKAPARFAFYIDTGEVPPAQAKAQVDEVRRRYKKRRIVDPATGKLDFRFNPLSQDEDFFVPTRSGKESSRIEVLSGPDYDDTNVTSYFWKKLLSALRIPPQYLGGTESTNRAALTQEDVQFARLEMRIQREFMVGMAQVVRVHLAALNIDPDTVKWAIRMPAPSSIFEMQQVEVWNARAALAAALQPFFTTPWIMANIFHMSGEDALFAAEAKQHEAEAQALGQASVQADIMQRFPELGPEGALALGAPVTGAPPMNGAPEQGGPPPEEAVRREVNRLIAEVREGNGRVLRTVRNTEHAVRQMGARAAKR
jgi:hypothetical protein